MRPEVAETREEDRAAPEALAPALIGVLDRELRALPPFGDDFRLEEPAVVDEVFFRWNPVRDTQKRYE